MEVEFHQSVTVKYDVDVFVAGGGPAGIAAAITAARCGARVYLAEKEQCFGGMGTAAKVPAFMRFSDGVNFLAGGIGKEIFDRLYGAEQDFTQIEYAIDTERLKVLYDEMMVESGAAFSFESTVVSLAHKDGKIDYVILKGKENLFAVKAKIYIDATGDGSLAVLAGAQSEKGNESGNMMPGTLCTQWTDIDWSRAVVELGKDPDNRMLAKAFEDNVFSVKDPGLPGMWKREDGLGGGNIGHVFGVDGTDEDSITKGIINARRRMKEYVKYYNEYLPGYEKAKLTATADVLGIRETRRMVCEYQMTVEDYFNQADFEDEIGRYCYPIDLHPSVIGEKSEYGALYYKGYGLGNSYGVPYRALLPRDTQNVLVTGRCIGADRAVMGSMRVMPACYITGMAAGAAGALAAAMGRPLREIPSRELRAKLRELGAYLPEKK